MDPEWEELLRIFEAQSSEGLAAIEESLLELEARPEDHESLNTIFRVCHTLKGDASSLGFSTIPEFAHALEDLLEGLRSDSIAISSDVVTQLLAAVDVLRTLLENALDGCDEATPESTRQLGLIRATLEGGAAASPGPADGASSASSTSAISHPAAEQRTLRVDNATLDRLTDLTGELAVARGQLAEFIASTPSSVGVELLEAHESMDDLFAELQEEVLKLRMIPIGPLFGRHRRWVRDLALEHGRQVRLEITGDDAELDTTVIEHLREVLNHLLRNAVTHGIEPPEQRLANGKGPCGRITLAACHHGSRIVVQVADDGAGLNLRRIRARAIESGYTAQAEELTDAQLSQLIFEPGFSTADGASLDSGRGVGLDAVRRSIEAVGGSIRVESVEDRGTQFTIRLPLTLAMIDGFVVGVGEEVYVIPLGSVVECVARPRETLQEPGKLAESGILDLRGSPLPYVSLGELLGVPGGGSDRESILVVGVERRQVGLVVDSLLGEDRSVIKPLDPNLRDLPAVAGSTIRGDGRVALILDVAALIDRASGPRAPTHVASSEPAGHSHSRAVS